MIKNAIISGTFKKEDILIETMICFKRAGADAIISYFALEIAQMLKNGH